VGEKRIWAIKAIIEADEEEAERVADTIGRVLCSDHHHPGPCPIPWLITRSEMDEAEQQEWHEVFADERAE
jgi:hypothetical protein